MAHACPECGVDVADDDRIVCDTCDTVPVRPSHNCPCCGDPIDVPDSPNARCEGCRAGDANNRCDPAITGHTEPYPFVYEPEGPNL